MWEKKRPMGPLLLAVLFLAACQVAAKPLLENDIDTPVYRLTPSVVPESYDIQLEPRKVDDKHDFDIFEGTVIIEAKVNEDLDTFSIHRGQDVDITSVTVSVVDLEGEEPEEPEETKCVDDKYFSSDEVEGNNLCHITLEDLSLKINDKIKITIEYKSPFPSGMYGFYKSYYTHGNEERVLLTTQFEPTHARKAFPCFDEPSFKATFKLTLTVPEGYEAISNTDSVTTKAGEKTIFKFKETPRMSTYLLAFIVYEPDSYTFKEGDKFSTYGRKSEIDLEAAELSQTYGPKIIKKMEEYTGIKYTLEEIDENVIINKPTKVDQAAIPDFSAGAMENWGLVTYREVALLFKEGKHSESARKRVIEVIGHELAHQWFGNLVTTHWWDSIWLNEGFATYFEYYLTENVLPEDWRMNDRLLVDEQMSALSVDEYDNAPPLTIPLDNIQKPSEVDSHFGTISYSKGGSVIRMFEDIIGSENFKNNLRTYLKENAGQDVKPENLFTQLIKDVSAEDTGLGNQHGRLKDILESWTTQSGFPLIQIDRNEESKNFDISQTQFLLIGDGTSKYNVKLTYISNQKDFGKQIIWLFDDGVNKSTSVIDSSNWILVQTTGYFRVNYDAKNWKALINQLHKQGGSDDTEELIVPLERAVLLDNALTLARAKTISYTLAIDVLNTLEHELDFIPWYAASRGLDFLHRMLVNSEKNGDSNTINTYILSLLGHVYSDFEENKPTDHIQKVHYGNIYNWACRVGHEKCVKQVEEDFPKYLALTDENLNTDIIGTVYCYTVKKNDVAWLQLWDKMLQEEDATIRSVIISALGCTTNKLALHMYLESVVSGTTIRAQDTASVFSSVYSNPDGIDVCLEYLERRVDAISDKANTALNAMTKIINGIASYLTTEDQKNRLEEIGDREDVDSTVRDAIKGALSTVETNIKWKADFEDDVLKAMKEKLGSGGSAWLAQPVTILTIAAVTIGFFV